MSYQQYTHNIIVSNSQELIENGVITVENGNTSIETIEKSANFKQDKATITIPGLINLHCHLALCGLSFKAQPLFTWLKELVKFIQMDQSFLPSPNSLEAAREAISTGTSFLVDNTSFPEESFEAFKTTGLKGLIGIEVFGSDPNLADEIFLGKLTQLRSMPESEDVDFCFSPHASYDVSPELWKQCLSWSRANSKLMLSHVAESEEEETWFKNQNADLAKDFWKSINTLDAKLEHWQAYENSIDFLWKNDMLAENLLLTHLCYAKDLEKLKKYNVKLCTCPRSNQFLDNQAADLASWEELGIDYGLGTDSTASNYDLDLRKELEKIKGLDAKRKFELVTSQAAQVLGKDDIGELKAGKSADWVVLETDTDINKDEIFDLILDTEKTRVKEVYINGSLVYPW